MTIPATNGCRARTYLLAVALLASNHVHSAYKCVVDGRTTYQERPCDNDVRKKGGESIVAPAQTRTDASGVVSKEENERRSGRVKSEYEPLARKAFSALTQGRMMDYRDMTCLRTRRMLSQTQGQSITSTDGKAWAERKVRLLELEPTADPLTLTFKAAEQLDPKKTWHRTPQQLYINAPLAIEDGKPCVNGFSEWSREIR